MKFKFLLSLICLMSFGINSLFSQPPSIPCPDDKIIGNKIYEWVAPGIWRYKADVPVGTLSALDCTSATHYGTLTEAVPASGVSSTVTYTGGNGGYYYGQTVTSTGVTGMTATLVAGIFASGIGTLTYNISGTPTTTGTASFVLNIVGQQCTLSRVVGSGEIAILNCASATNNGTLVEGVAASGVSFVISYTGGNGGPHPGQTVTSTGVTGLTATLTAGAFANGAGTVTYTITGTPGAAGTASFALNIGGQQCTVTSLVGSGEIAVLNCASATNNGTLVEGVAASGVSFVINYSGGNGGPHTGQTVTSTGVTGLTATLAAGSFANGAGTVTYTITGTPGAAGTASFALNIGGQQCTVTSLVGSGEIAILNCSSATHYGTLTEAVQASGVSSTVTYTGGNGGYHYGQTVTSTGVTGMTATLVAGTFASGIGTLTYNISGTPTASGTASFVLNIGGQSCTLTRNVNASYPHGTVHCISPPTTIVDVYNPSTGKTWMDRNLGANQKATGSTDAASYGDLYQWGRRADGHQCRNSATTATLSNSDQPPHGNFILPPSSPSDWRSPQNDNLWQGVNGVNNPCPGGYRLPTETELNAERLSWSPNNNASGAFASPLKLPRAGRRNINDGSFSSVGSIGYYWSSSVSSTNSPYLRFEGTDAYMENLYRALGHSVRCIKN